MSGSTAPILLNMTSTRPGSRSLSAGPAPRYGTVQHLDSGHAFEQLAGEMHRGAVTGRGEGDLPGVGLGVGDEVGDRMGGRTHRHRLDIGVLTDTRDGRDSGYCCVIELENL